MAAPPHLCRFPYVRTIGFQSSGQAVSLHRYIQQDFTYNNEAFREAIHYAGCFVLITASPIDTFDTLQKFRQREKVEEFYRLDKQNFDGNRTRVWYPDSLNVFIVK